MNISNLHIKINSTFQYIFLFFLILFFFQSCGVEDFDEKNVLNCSDIMFEGGKATINGKLLSGSCFITDKNNSLVELRSYKAGIKSGRQRGYYVGSDNIQYEGFIKKGEIHGSYKRYYINGNIESEGQFNKGFYSGKWNFFDENGDIIMRKIYSKKNGKLIDSVWVN